MNDTTIEERVALLEFQVAELTDDVTLLTDDVIDVEEGLTLVKSEQLIQNEKIFELELDTSSEYYLTIFHALQVKPKMCSHCDEIRQYIP